MLFQFRGNRFYWFPTKSFITLTTGYFSVNICNAIKCAFIQHLHHSCNQTRFHSFPQKSRLFILSNEILGPKLFTCLVVMGGLVVDTCIVSSIIKFLTFSISFLDIYSEVTSPYKFILLLKFYNSWFVSIYLFFNKNFLFSYAKNLFDYFGVNTFSYSLF